MILIKRLWVWILYRTINARIIELDTAYELFSCRYKRIIAIYYIECWIHTNVSTNPSTDPVPYRKDLRKKMNLEDKDSENTSDQNKSNSNHD